MKQPIQNEWKWRRMYQMCEPHHKWNFSWFQSSSEFLSASYFICSSRIGSTQTASERAARKKKLVGWLLAIAQRVRVPTCPLISPGRRPLDRKTCPLRLLLNVWPFITPSSSRFQLQVQGVPSSSLPPTHHTYHSTRSVKVHIHPSADDTKRNRRPRNCSGTGIRNRKVLTQSKIQWICKKVLIFDWTPRSSCRFSRPFMTELCRSSVPTHFWRASRIGLKEGPLHSVENMVTFSLNF